MPAECESLPEDVVLARECVRDMRRRNRSGKRQVAARYALGDGHNVWNDAIVLHCEHPARAPETGNHLVGDKQYAVAIAYLAHHGPVFV